MPFLIQGMKRVFFVWLASYILYGKNELFPWPHRNKYFDLVLESQREKSGTV
jgi:hypothetical protein